MLPEQGVGKIGENSHWQKTAPITLRSPRKATQMDLCQKQLQKELLLGKEYVEIIKFVQGDVFSYKGFQKENDSCHSFLRAIRTWLQLLGISACGLRHVISS